MSPWGLKANFTRTRGPGFRVSKGATASRPPSWGGRSRLVVCAVSVTSGGRMCVHELSPIPHRRLAIANRPSCMYLHCKD
jgi:hypothetical protein